MDEKRHPRELKFRAWNPEEKIMGPPFTIGDFVDAYPMSDNIDTTGIIYLQWTGLKDKHGKDIYEGDILKFFDKVVATVVWKDFGGWSFNWIDPRYKVIRQQNPEPFFHNINLFEIVGNIYTSPELSES